MSAPAGVRDRALASRGQSSAALYRRAAVLLRESGVRGIVADVGCGEGRLRALLDGIASSYLGIDAVRFPAFPADVTFHEADLDCEPLPLGDCTVDAAVAIETVEHLENPRRLVRELARVTRPGGVVLVSTPNQVSALSLLSLAARQRFVAFQEPDYPAHLTALLPIDLEHIARECGLHEPRIAYSHRGRVPLTRWHYPPSLSRLSPRLLSDHVFLLCRRGR